MQCDYYFVQTDRGTYRAKISILAYARELPLVLPTFVGKTIGLGDGGFFAEIQSP